MSRLFTLAGLYPGAAAEPLTHERLPLIDALTKWRHPLRQEAALLAAGLGPPQLRLVQADSLTCKEKTNAVCIMCGAAIPGVVPYWRWQTPKGHACSQACAAADAPSDLR